MDKSRLPNYLGGVRDAVDALHHGLQDGPFCRAVAVLVDGHERHHLFAHPCVT